MDNLFPWKPSNGRLGSVILAGVMNSLNLALYVATVILVAKAVS